ncbi:hypothetical protein JHK85_028421 [Glycine max]|nr:hypothetical protein JHK85_028421 [Glycine max]
MIKLNLLYLLVTSRISSSDYEDQISFLGLWLNEHIQDAENTLHKPLLFGQFGISTRSYGGNSRPRDQLFNMVYSTIYSSASSGGVAVGGLFWQLMAQVMDAYRDGYENEDHKRVSSCQEIESPQEDAVHGHVSQDSDTAMESTRVMWIKREECSFVCLHMAVKGVSCEALRYGKLQGLNKQETAKRYGKEKVHEWHKSFDIPPPKGESLEMCS